MSTSPAFFTAVTRVDSSGLVEAAVATGWSAIAVRLPSPEAGTDEHAGPNGSAAACGDADAEVAPASEVASVIAAAMRMPFMVFSH
ncbi:hypothetical protein [Nonomuraea roseola]|uniref:hypothetical protein n=1 Tax=Nonomuraea roseola TaxID=46179 RepID=UPI0033711367